MGGGGGGGLEAGEGGEGAWSEGVGVGEAAGCWPEEALYEHGRCGVGGWTVWRFGAVTINLLVYFGTLYSLQFSLFSPRHSLEKLDRNNVVPKIRIEWI